MPRNVRNFWLELAVDGSATRIETGPRAKEGGFSLEILQRDNGGILQTLTVRGFVNTDGQLQLQAYVPREAESKRVQKDVDPTDILVRTSR